MADSTSHPVDDLLDTKETAPGGAQSSWFGKVKLLLFAVAVVLVECLIAYLLIPAAGETPAVAASPVKHEPAKAEHAEEKQELAEVDLGRFGVTAYQPGTNSTLLIDFHLYGTVTMEDREAFTLAIEEHMHRFRDQVIVIARSAELTELTEAGLGLMKRKILDKGNRVLGTPYLRSVMFSDFSFVEQ